MRVTKFGCFLFAILLALTGRVWAQTEAFQHADCWLENSSGYQVSFHGTNPTTPELQLAIETLAGRYGVPAQIIGAVCQQQSGTFQFGSDAFLTHNLPSCKALFNGTATGGPPGMGLMQVAGATARQYVLTRLVSDWEYNLEAGVQVLADKYEAALADDPEWLKTAKRQNSHVLENWFSPLAHYHGLDPADPFPFTVFNWIQTPPARLSGLWTPVAVTRPADAIPGWTYGTSFVARADGQWTTVIGATSTAAVHFGAAVSAPAAPALAVAAGPEPIASGQTVELGTVTRGAAPPGIQIRITNAGGQALHWSPSAAPAGFRVLSVTDTTLLGGRTGTLMVFLDTSTIGARSGTLRIESDDPARPVFDVALRGTVTVENYRHAECWLELDSGYPNLYGSNPSGEELASELRSLAQRRELPGEVLAAVCLQASNGFQYGSDGFVVHDMSSCVALHRAQGNGPPGLGLMKLTGGTARLFDVPRLIGDWRYNLYAGVRILEDHYEIALASDAEWLKTLIRANAGVIENWMHALASYGGTRADTTFPEAVFDRMLAWPERLGSVFSPVVVTRPHAVIPHWTPGHSFAAQADGTWRCAHEQTFQGPVHVSQVGIPLAPRLAVSGSNGDLTSGQGPALEFGALARGAPSTSRTFVLRNAGGMTLQVGSIAAPPGFRITLDGGPSLRAEDTARLTVTLDGSAVGVRSGSVRIPTNDPALPAFLIPVAGSVSGQTFALSVNSVTPNEAVAITLDFPDDNGRTAGSTPFSMVFGEGNTIVLRAPAISGGRVFARWRKNGVDVPGGNAALATTVDGANAYTAVYTEPSGVPLTAFQHEKCWLEKRSGYNTTFRGTNPTAPELQAAIRALAARYEIPVEIIAGVCQQESSSFQYGSDGFIVHNLDECTRLYEGSFNEAPPGLGLMQLTYVTAQQFDVGRLISNWQYNLEAGVQVLADKYHDATEVQEPFLRDAARLNANLLENWFYPLAYYNGYRLGNPYPYQIYDWIGAVPPRFIGLYEPTRITRPEQAITDWTYGHGFVARADGSWACAHATAYQASVTPGSGLANPVAPAATLSATPGGALVSGQSSPLGFGSVARGGAAPSIQIAIVNTGGRTLEWGSVQVPRGFLVSDMTNTSLRAGRRGTFTLTLETVLGGTKDGTVSISTNDPSRPSFRFPVAGTVVSPVRTLSITSSDAISVTASRADTATRSTGTTPLSLTYYEDTSLTLTAPANASGRIFDRWQRDGADVAGSSRTLDISVDANRSYRALYRALAPALRLNGGTAAVSVDAGRTFQVDVVDWSGNTRDWVALYRAGESTYSSWLYVNGAPLTFTAPPTAGSYVLKLWQGSTAMATSAAVNVPPPPPPALTLNGSTAPIGAAAGASMTVGVENWSGDTKNWIGVYPVGGSSYVAWTWVTARTLSLSAPNTGGNFELRLYAGSATPAAKSAVISVTPPPPPTLSLNGSATSQTVSAGARLSIAIERWPGDPKSWVCICPAGGPGSSYVAWAWATSGALSLTAPLTPGNYDVRLIPSSGSTPLAVSSVVRVIPPVLSVNGSSAPVAVAAGAQLSLDVSGWSGNTGDWIGLYPNGSSSYTSWKYVTGSPLSFSAPSGGGTCTFRLYTGSTVLATSALVSVAPPPPPALTVNSGAAAAPAASSLSVAVERWSGDTKNWIGLHPAGVSGSTYVAWAWVTGSTVRLLAPPSAGRYEARLYAGSAVLATSPAFSIDVPQIAINGSTSAIQTAPGATLAISIANYSGNPKDWLSLAPVSAPDNTSTAWQYVTTAGFTFRAPTAPGTYTLRLFADNSYTRLTQSAVLTVR